MQMLPDHASFARAERAELPPAPTFEVRSAAVLCYPGASLHEIAEPFHMLIRVEREQHAGYEVALVGPSAGTVRAAGGLALRPDHWLDTGVPAFDLLVVPCGFIGSEAFAVRGAVPSLVRAVQGARRVLLIARTLQQARRAQMLLQGASTWPVGSFWEAVRPGHDPVVTSFIVDGSLTWAMGPSAARDGVARLILENEAIAWRAAA
jgi:transcriptional regulator GlxA family with amidase domain